MREFPKFVKFQKDGPCCLRHVGDGEYWRDGGLWGVKSAWLDGHLQVSGNTNPMLKTLNGQILLECTEDEWRTDNGSYAPKITPRNVAK